MKNTNKRLMDCTDKDLRDFLDLCIQKHNEEQKGREGQISDKKRPGGRLLPNPFPIVYDLKISKNEGE